MCFEATRSGVARIAKEDIIAYKCFSVMGSRIDSPYKIMIWTVGDIRKENSFVRVVRVGGSKQLNYGFHALRTLKDARQFMRDHAGNTILEVVIPQGALYFVNKTQIVTDTMYIGSDLPVRRTKPVYKKKVVAKKKAGKKK